MADESNENSKMGGHDSLLPIIAVVISTAHSMVLSLPRLYWSHQKGSGKTAHMRAFFESNCSPSKIMNSESSMSDVIMSCGLFDVAGGDCGAFRFNCAF